MHDEQRFILAHRSAKRDRSVEACVQVCFFCIEYKCVDQYFNSFGNQLQTVNSRSVVEIKKIPGTCHSSQYEPFFFHNKGIEALFSDNGIQDPIALPRLNDTDPCGYISECPTVSR